MGWRGRLIRLSAIVAGIALVILLGSSFGYRYGLVDLLVAFGGLRVGLMVAGAALLLSLIGIIWSFFVYPRRGLSVAILVFLVAGVAAGIPAYQIGQAMTGKYPPIHDITTDMVNPPEFVEIAKIRGENTNSIIYSEKVVADNPRIDPAMVGRNYVSIQTEYYPDIKPLELDVSPDEAYWAAMEVVQGEKWEIVANDLNGLGHIEATATTKWFGFKDDVIIVISPLDGDTTKSKVDMRSSSRVGTGDIGANAKRIKKFLKAVEKKSKAIKG